MSNYEAAPVLLHRLPAQRAGQRPVGNHGEAIMTCSSYTTLKCDNMYNDERCDVRFVFDGDAGQTRARAKKEGWSVAQVITDPLRPFKVKRQDFCPLHKATVGTR